MPVKRSSEPGASKVDKGERFGDPVDLGRGATN